MLIRSVNSLSFIGGLISGACIFIMMLIVSLQVLMRYVFRSPTLWTEEISIFLLMGGAFLALAYTQREGRHVRIDLITSRLSLRARTILDIVTSIMAMGFFVVFIWQGGKMAWRSYDRHIVSGSMLEAPLFPTQFLVPIAGVLLFLQFLVTVISLVKSLSGKNTAAGSQ